MANQELIHTWAAKYMPDPPPSELEAETYSFRHEVLTSFMKSLIRHVKAGEFKALKGYKGKIELDYKDEAELNLIVACLDLVATSSIRFDIIITNHRQAEDCYEIYFQIREGA